MFIQTEATPNPATLKYIPGRAVLDQGTLEFTDPAEGKDSPLASRLFEIDGVKGVFFGPDFISVTKGEGEWQHLKPAILGAIMEHYVSGEAVTVGEPSGSESAESEFYAPEVEETVKTIKEATSPSRAIARASSIFPCAAPAPVVRPRRRRSATASRTCFGTSSQRCKRFARFERQAPRRLPGPAVPRGAHA